MLDVGCGEGVLTEQWADRDRRPAGSWGSTSRTPSWPPNGRAARRPNLTFAPMEVERLEFADGEFELVAATEVLEHVTDPERALAEMARVAGRHLLVSVPHEPLWRALNMARGAYLRQLGNTPGHLNHWTRRSFVSLLGRYGEVVEVRAPFPWTMLLVASPRVSSTTTAPSGGAGPDRRRSADDDAAGRGRPAAAVVRLRARAS